jgi:hypothetical protein
MALIVTPYCGGTLAPKSMLDNLALLEGYGLQPVYFSQQVVGL